MFFGSFCRKRESKHVADLMYRVYRLQNTLSRTGPMHLIDLYSGTMCFSELALRAGIVRKSTSSRRSAKIVDIRPYPRLIELFSLRRTKARPVLPKGLKLRVEAEDPALADLADALNEVISDKQKRAQQDVRAPYKLRSPFATMAPELVRICLEEGLVEVILESAETRVKRRLRSKTKNLRKSGIVRLLDPPRRGVDAKQYYGTNFDWQEQFLEHVMNELRKHGAGPILYVDSKEGVETVLKTFERSVLGYYNIYSNRKPALLVALYPPVVEGIQIDTKKKRAIAEHLLPNNILNEYSARRKSKQSVFEFFGLQARRKPFVNILYERLPERDRLKDTLKKLLE